MTRRPRRSPLFPSTPLFRSRTAAAAAAPLVARHAELVLDRGHRRGGEPHPRLEDRIARSEEHTSELQSRQYLVCRLLLEKKKQNEHRALHDHHTDISNSPLR